MVLSSLVLDNLTAASWHKPSGGKVAQSDNASAPPAKGNEFESLTSQDAT